MVTREQRKRANGQLTVKDLMKLCKEAVDNGYGDKFIMVGDDNEGNGYHGMFFGFTDIKEFYSMEDYMGDTNMTMEELIVLG